MRPLSELRFIAQRVIEHVRANPPTLPLLGEPTPPELVYLECRVPGHSGMVPRRAGRQRCIVCGREQKRRKRATGRVE